MLSNFFHNRSFFSDFDRTIDRLTHRMEHDFKEAFRPFEDTFGPLSLPFSNGNNNSDLIEAERLAKPFFDFPNFKSIFEQDIDIDKMTPLSIEDEAHTYYKMSVMTNQNGHVKTKTMEKEPGKEWQIKEEEYDRNNDKAIEQGLDNKEKLMAVDNEGEEGKEECQIEDNKF
jgi:hypothetical protein